MEYFFGKVTMYTSFNIEARDMILFFMRKYFKDTEKLVEPITPLEIHIDDNKLGKILCGNNYDEDYRILSRYVREHGENIPPGKCLHEPVAFHENLWDGHKFSFGGVEETAILIKIADVYETKKARHISNHTIPRILRLRKF